jgi:uncharacterized protein with PQ loop repeat|tara:strand:+ start:220 stop:525 length:306 start_codon:yes stop_codon:yes gene_type:complete
MNINEIMDLLGLIGSILVGICFIPQTYKTINSNEINDISMSFIIINITAATLMSIYGCYYLIIPVIVANGSVLLNCFIIGYCVLKNKKNIENNISSNIDNV